MRARQSRTAPQSPSGSVSTRSVQWFPRITTASGSGFAESTTARDASASTPNEPWARADSTTPAAKSVRQSVRQFDTTTVDCHGRRRTRAAVTTAPRTRMVEPESALSERRGEIRTPATLTRRTVTTHRVAKASGRSLCATRPPHARNLCSASRATAPWLMEQEGALSGGCGDTFRDTRAWDRLYSAQRCGCCRRAFCVQKRGGRSRPFARVRRNPRFAGAWFRERT